MSEQKFSIINRFSQFWSNLSNKKLMDRQTIKSWLGWSISLIFLVLIYTTSDNKFWQFFFIVHIFFLLPLLADIYQKWKPPVELSLLAQYLILLAANATMSGIGEQLQQPKALLLALLILLVSFSALNFAVIFVHNSEGRRKGLIGISILCLIGYETLAIGNEYLIFFFQALLIISLLQKTRWLEELTKTECWIYIVLMYLFFRTIVHLNPFESISSKELAGANGWFVLTKIFYLLFKFYALAMLIKIPIVLIYNHASLSRKLKISGMFQSTFPQLIQFVLLILIFYSFLSGWQAENLRRSVQSQLKKIEDGKADPTIESFKIDLKATGFSDEAFNYEPLVSLKSLSGTGVIEMRRRDSVIPFIKPKPDYFIFSKTSESAIYLVKIDSKFLESLTHNLRYLAGTSMVAYPLVPEKWISYIYKADFLWQRDRHIRIFPLGALPQKTDSAVSIQLEYPQTRIENVLNKVEFLFKDKYQFIFGRVYLPFWQADSFENKYLAFDIIMKLEPVILFSGLPQILLVLLVIYLLFNSFVLQQVVKFGSQINETIIQKFRQLQKGIQQIATGDLDHKIKLEGEDEFVDLAKHFNKMGEQLKKKITEARERELFEHELRLAREVQLSLLPQQLPEIPGFQIAASMRTANTVGGDFYDIFPLDKNRYLFTIGDVSGKGSSAALYMAQCMSLVRYSRQFTIEPAEISSRLNSYFAASISDRQIFVTAIIGILDTKANTMQFVRAGHTEPIFIPGDMNKRIQIIESKGIGIGLTRSARVFEKTIKSYKLNLNPGDTLMFYTDGIIEAARLVVESQVSDFELYGEDRLQNLMKKVREKPASEILHTIEQDVDLFYAGSTRVDDHTVLIIQRSHQ